MTKRADSSQILLNKYREDYETIKNAQISCVTVSYARVVGSSPTLKIRDLYTLHCFIIPTISIWREENWIPGIEVRLENIQYPQREWGTCKQDEMECSAFRERDSFSPRVVYYKSDAPAKYLREFWKNSPLVF